MSAWRPEWDEAAREGRGGGVQIGPVSVPKWTKRLLIANAVIWLVLYLAGDLGWRISGALAVNPSWWWADPPHLPLWQLVTYGLVHDLSGAGHLLFNSISLFFFGSMLERAVGGRRFLLVYGGAVLLGGVLHAVLSPVGVELVPGPGGAEVATGPFLGPMVGASGAIMACIVASAMLFPRSQILLLFIPVPLWVGAAILVTLDLLGFARIGGTVAHHVHLAGALLGFLYIKLGWHHRKVPNPVAVVAEKRREAEQRGLARDDERMDALLAKISREGMSALTQAEKDFLKRMSQRR